MKFPDHAATWEAQQIRKIFVEEVTKQQILQGRKRDFPRHESEEAWKEGGDSKAYLKSFSLVLDKWNIKAKTQ